MISTMPHFKATHHPATSALAEFDPFAAFQEDVSALFNGTDTPPSPLGTASKRRRWFSKEENRTKIVYTPEHVLQVDFAYGYFQFPELTLALPGGISFDLKKYWNHQPVRFVCCERGLDGLGPGELFFVVQFDVVEDDDDLEAESEEPPRQQDEVETLADDID